MTYIYQRCHYWRTSFGLFVRRHLSRADVVSGERVYEFVDSCNAHEWELSITRNYLDIFSYRIWLLSSCGLILSPHFEPDHLRVQLEPDGYFGAPLTLRQVRYGWRSDVSRSHDNIRESNCTPSELPEPLKSLGWDTSNVILEPTEVQTTTKNKPELRRFKSTTRAYMATADLCYKALACELNGNTCASSYGAPKQPASKELAII
ncbi:hypothetical protein RF11_03624 [Thelohanellus kitauei]|uniref:Uncharacterized protein n=1 Tax=Thelohanellus kitauei TaxID=669202 RepID=A0A0C2MIC7_THEKT|nr:hypothetical protein RF11_03624 [Thelohanellus kitauei]